MDAFGEVAAQYAGYSPSDPAFDAYWAVAAKYGVPVGIHTGGGPSRTPYTCCPKFRLKLGDPLLLEDILVKYPKLKVYVMHAGEFFPENALMLMTMYPQIYVDIGRAAEASAGAFSRDREFGWGGVQPPAFGVVERSELTRRTGPCS